MNISSLLHISGSLFKYYLFGKRTPLTISYLSTYTCNQKCKYCDWTKLDLNQINTQQALSMIQSFKKSGVIKLGFAGGESLNRKDIDLLLECAHKSKLISSISSNGRAVPAHIHAIKKYVDVVQLSLDGPQAIHDELRGNGSFENVMTAIELLKSHNVKTIINTVLTKRNLGELSFILDLAKKYNCKALFQPVFCYDISEREDLIHSLRPTHYEMQLAIDYLIYQKRHSKNVGNSIAFLKYIKKTWNNQDIIRCHANNLFCSVDPMGYILPCCFDVRQNKEYNAVELGFEQAFLNSEKNDYVRNCKGCYCNAYIESNLAFSFYISACINGLSII